MENLILISVNIENSRKKSEIHDHLFWGESERASRHNWKWWWVGSFSKFTTRRNTERKISGYFFIEQSLKCCLWYFHSSTFSLHWSVHRGFSLFSLHYVLFCMRKEEFVLPFLPVSVKPQSFLGSSTILFCKLIVLRVVYFISQIGVNFEQTIFIFSIQSTCSIFFFSRDILAHLRAAQKLNWLMVAHFRMFHWEKLSYFILIGKLLLAGYDGGPFFQRNPQILIYFARSTDSRL